MKKLIAKNKWVIAFMALSILTSCAKGCKKEGAKTGTGSQADALDMVPANNNLLISLNVKKLSTLPLYADMTKDAPAEVKELAQNVNDALIAVSVRNPSEAPSGLAIVSGNFDEKKVVGILEESAKKQGLGEVKRESVEGKTLYISPKDPNIGMIFVGTNQAMWGQIPTLKEALNLAAKKGGQSIRTNKELMDLFSKRDPQKLLWGSALLPQNATPPAQPGDPLASLQSLKAFTLGLDYNKDLAIDWTGYAADAPQAQNILNLINSYKTIFGASIASQEPMWGQVIQSAQITSQDKSISIGLKLSEELLKQISQKVAVKKESAGALPPESMGAPMPPPAPVAATQPAQ
ncbi:MAG: hypothetical protein JNK65_06235 [Deltaproteobacteria bacterium]|nr:hypothetical protein [Deltaproteobacteria bacterium]